MIDSRPGSAPSLPGTEPSVGGPIPAEDIWRATEELLASSEHASVVAIGENGLFLPMPAGLPLYGHPVIEGHASALELVAPSDMTAVIDAWKRTLTDGACRVEVEPLNAPGIRMMLHFMDVRAQFQVLLGVAVRTDRQSGFSTARGQADVLRPRFSSVRKNQLSEFVEIDAAFELLLGYSRDELIGQRNLELIHPDDHAVAIANWMDLLAAPGRSRRVRLRQRHRDGRWIWFEVTNHNRLNDPIDPAVVAEMVDISDEMAAHEAVRNREQLLVRLTESLPVGVLQVDPAGAVVHRNARVSELLDPPAGDELADIFAGVSIGDSAGLNEVIATARQLGQDADLELTVRRNDGATIRCRVTVRALTDDDGAPTGALICIDDVTEGARLRERLHQQATLDALPGCHNRASILAVTEEALDTAAWHGSGVAVVFVDLDGCKQINDSQGHAAGERLLIDIAGCLRQTLRHDDAIGRIGGDEFLVVGREVRSAEQALELGKRLAAALPRMAADESRPALTSIGVAWRAPVGPALSDPSAVARPKLPSGQSAADQLVALADAAMYQSKAERAGRPVLHPAE